MPRRTRSRKRPPLRNHIRPAQDDVLRRYPSYGTITAYNIFHDTLQRHAPELVFAPSVDDFTIGADKNTVIVSVFLPCVNSTNRDRPNLYATAKCDREDIFDLLIGIKRAAARLAHKAIEHKDDFVIPLTNVPALLESYYRTPGETTTIETAEHTA